MNWLKDKGASNRLTTLPIDENGFTLHKGAFHDAIMAGFHLTYTLPALVEHHSVEQALFCPFGGFPSIRHSEIHWQKSATMFPLRQTSCPPQERHLLLNQQTRKMLLSQTLQLMVFEVAIQKDIFRCQSCQSLYSLQPCPLTIQLLQKT